MRVTSSHWEAFLEIAEKNPTLLTNKFNGAQGKSLGNTLWQSVAIKLNSLGYGEKTVNEWRRAVTDWKSKVKSKASKIRNCSLRTGGGSSDAPPLTPLEEKLLSLMGTKSFEGDVGVQELGQSTFQKSYHKVSTSEVANEVEVVGESSQTDIDHDYLITKKRHNDDEETDHAPTPQTRKRLKSIPRISKSLLEITSESLNILRSIDTNISRMADSIQGVVDIIRKQ